MKRQIILKAAVFCAAAAAALALAACKATDTGGASVSAPRAASTPAQQGAQQQQQAANPSGAQRVSIQELQAMLARGEAVVVDVRSKDAYDAGHIKGAILIPDNEVAARAGELPRDKKIVTYCA